MKAAKQAVAAAILSCAFFGAAHAAEIQPAPEVIPEHIQPAPEVVRDEIQPAPIVIPDTPEFKSESSSGALFDKQPAPDNKPSTAACVANSVSFGTVGAIIAGAATGGTGTLVASLVGGAISGTVAYGVCAR